MKFFTADGWWAIPGPGCLTFSQALVTDQVSGEHSCSDMGVSRARNDKQGAPAPHSRLIWSCLLSLGAEVSQAINKPWLARRAGYLQSRGGVNGAQCDEFIPVPTFRGPDNTSTGWGPINTHVGDAKMRHHADRYEFIVYRAFIVIRKS